MEKIVDELVDMLYAVDDPIRGFKKKIGRASCRERV